MVLIFTALQADTFPEKAICPFAFVPAPGLCPFPHALSQSSVQLKGARDAPLFKPLFLCGCMRLFTVCLFFCGRHWDVLTTQIPFKEELVGLAAGSVVSGQLPLQGLPFQGGPHLVTD